MDLKEKHAQINLILDDAMAELEALGAPYFLAAIDRDTRDPDGGKVFVNSEVKGHDMQIIFKHAFPANKDIAALGLWVGAEIMRRNKAANIKFVDKKRKKPAKGDAPKLGQVVSEQGPEKITSERDTGHACPGPENCIICAQQNN